jgi:hypothetical protein
MPKEAAEQVYAQMKEIVPMKRIGQVEEIANGSSLFLPLTPPTQRERSFP